MLSRVFKSSALLKEVRRAAHALKAIGLCAKVAIIFGVNPRFLVNVSRVSFESAGTWSVFRAALLGIAISGKDVSKRVWFLTDQCADAHFFCLTERKDEGRFPSRELR